LKLFSYFRSGPEAPLRDLSEAQLHREYNWRRWEVFLGVMFGYGFFYVARVNLSVIKKPLLDEGIFTPTQLGAAGSAMLAVYAVGKLMNGILADRAWIGRFMGFSLLGAAAINLALGFNTSFLVLLVLWGLNGWFLSAGSAPSVVALSQWFSPREMGTRYGVWSCSHSIGEGLTFVFTSLLVAGLGWRMGFFGPALVCSVAALLLMRFVHDRPRTLGLPAVEDYKQDHSAKAKPQGSVAAMQKVALRSPAVWLLGLASANMYVARYGLNNWGVLFLQESKGYDLASAGVVMGLCPMAGLLGGMAGGWVSDRFFAARRQWPCFLMGAGQVAALLLVWWLPPGVVWLDGAAMVFFGFNMGGLIVFLGGLWAVDLVPAKAAGAAMGLVGCFSYMGAAFQDLVSGMLLEGGGHGVPYDFDALFAFWLGASVLSLVLTTALGFGRPLLARIRG
jgi:OPA family sugar phosphate sensor protein UhpC-like MFS transporter